MAKYVHGSMDYEVQEKTFARFIKIVAWCAGLIILFLAFLAMVDG